ncbi:MAG: hypothetical protein WBP85_01975 [Terracidiphilus sp.]
MPNKPNSEHSEDYYDADDPPLGVTGSEVDSSEENGEHPNKAIGYASSAAKYVGKTLSFPFRWLFRQTSERLTAVATIVIAFFTIALSITSILQWRVMKEQLGEMHASGTDTHNLAVAAGNQAIWTQRLSDNMKTQADRTGELAGATKQMASDNGDLLRDTQGVKMDFQLRINPLDPTIDVSGENHSEITSKWVNDDLLITVRDWKSKKAIMNHPILRNKGYGPIKPTVGNLNPIFSDHFPIRYLLNKQIIEDLNSGKDYLTVEWRASYDDGFRGIDHFPSKSRRLCVAAIAIESERCAQETNTPPIVQFPCDDIEASVKERQLRMNESQKKCNDPN